MTLDEIRGLLQLRDKPADNCAEVNSVLDAAHPARGRPHRAICAPCSGSCMICGSCAPAPISEGCGILKELARGTEQPRAAGAARHVRGSHSPPARR